MADPFSIAGGAIALAGTGFKIANTLNDFIRTARKAEKSLKPLIDDIQTVSHVLTQVGTTLENTKIRTACKDEFFLEARKTLSKCRASLYAVEDFNKGLWQTSSKMKVSAKLGMYFKQPELDGLRRNVSDSKESLGLVMLTLQFVMIMRTATRDSDAVTELKKDIQHHIDEAEVRQRSRPSDDGQLSIAAESTLGDSSTARSIASTTASRSVDSRRNDAGNSSGSDECRTYDDVPRSIGDSNVADTSASSKPATPAIFSQSFAMSSSGGKHSPSLSASVTTDSAPPNPIDQRKPFEPTMSPKQADSRPLRDGISECLQQFSRISLDLRVQALDLIDLRQMGRDYNSEQLHDKFKEAQDVYDDLRDFEAVARHTKEARDASQGNVILRLDTVHPSDLSPEPQKSERSEQRPVYQIADPLSADEESSEDELDMRWKTPLSGSKARRLSTDSRQASATIPAPAEELAEAEPETSESDQGSQKVSTRASDESLQSLFNRTLSEEPTALDKLSVELPSDSIQPQSIQPRSIQPQSIQPQNILTGKELHESEGSNASDVSLEQAVPVEPTAAPVTANDEAEDAPIPGWKRPAPKTSKNKYVPEKYGGPPSSEFGPPPAFITPHVTGVPKMPTTAKPQMHKVSSGASSWFSKFIGGDEETESTGPAALKITADDQTNGPIKAKLGEENSYYFDKDLGRWCRKAASPSQSSSSTEKQSCYVPQCANEKPASGGAFGAEERLAFFSHPSSLAGRVGSEPWGRSASGGRQEEQAVGSSRYPASPRPLSVETNQAVRRQTVAHSGLPLSSATPHLCRAGEAQVPQNMMFGQSIDERRYIPGLFTMNDDRREEDELLRDAPSSGGLVAVDKLLRSWTKLDV